MGEEDAVRGGLIPVSGLSCENVNSVGEEILHLSGKSKGISETSGYGNHDC